MKKLLAMVLALLMLGAAFSAVAESDNVIYFDESVVAGVEGEFVGLEGLGLMFFLPAEFEVMEMTEEDLAGGGIAAFKGTETAMSIAAKPVTDGAGTPITTLEDLTVLYNLSGLNANLIVLNNVPGVLFDMNDGAAHGMAYMTSEGYVLAFTFAPACELSAAVLTSIMPME